MVAYKNRSAVLDPAYTKLANTGTGTLFPIKKDSLEISPNHFAKLKRAETNAINEAGSRYGKFLGAPIVSP